MFLVRPFSFSRLYGSLGWRSPAGLTVRERLFNRSRWRKRKHGFVLRLPKCISAGIAVSRSHGSSMVSNTCCTMLMATSAPGVAKSAAANPP